MSNRRARLKVIDTQYTYAYYTPNNFNFQHVYGSFRRPSTSWVIHYFRFESVSAYVRPTVGDPLNPPVARHPSSREPQLAAHQLCPFSAF